MINDSGDEPRSPRKHLVLLREHLHYGKTEDWVADLIQPCCASANLVQIACKTTLRQFYMIFLPRVTASILLITGG